MTQKYFNMIKQFCKPDLEVQISFCIITKQKFSADLKTFPEITGKFKYRQVQIV